MPVPALRKPASRTVLRNGATDSQVVVGASADSAVATSQLQIERNTIINRASSIGRSNIAGQVDGIAS